MHEDSNGGSPSDYLVQPKNASYRLKAIFCVYRLSIEVWRPSVTELACAGALRACKQNGAGDGNRTQERSGYFPLVLITLWQARATACDWRVKNEVRFAPAN